MLKTGLRWLEAFHDALPGRVVVDPDIIESHRRDQACLAEAGIAAALVRAHSTAEVQAVMRFAHAHHVPVVPRGAGTGLTGGANAVDGCIVLSLAPMNRILKIDSVGMFAVVEPGVINADLRRAARSENLFYAPDPASYEMCTIGGNIATNAGGLCCVKYGVTRDSVLGLEVVLASGEILRCGSPTLKGVAGYDLTRLFVGSEGTLGIVTQACLRLRPLPSAEMTMVAFFPTMRSAGEAITRIVHDCTPSLLEIMDGTTIRAVERWKPMGLNTEAAAMLLARSDSPDSKGDVERFAGFCRDVGATFAACSEDETEAELLMAARRNCVPALERGGSILLDDVAVPISRLPEMFEAVDALARRIGVIVGNFGHAGDGNLHPTIVFERSDPTAVDRARRAFDAILEEALRLGGTITGEHGVGLLKRRMLAEEVGSVGTAIHRAIKSALDPQNILNPGKALPGVMV